MLPPAISPPFVDVARPPLPSDRDAPLSSVTTQLIPAEVAAGAAPGDLAVPALGSAVRSAAVYVLMAAVQRGIIFLLLPVYTRVLDPAAYGQLSVLLAIAALASILLSCGLDTAFFRSYFALRGDPERQQRFVTTVWVFLLVVPPAGAAVVTLGVAPLLASMQGLSPAVLAMAMAGAAIFVSATVVPLSLLRAEERLRDFVVLSAVTSVATAGFTLIAVVPLHGGVMGWLIAVVAANLVTLAVAVRLIPLRLSGGFDRGLVAAALALGLPLVPHVLAHWGLGVSNRVVLGGMVSSAKVGIYALAANLALPVAIVMQSMGNAVMPTYARAASEPAQMAPLRKVMIVQFLAVLAIATLGSLVGPIAVRYLAPSRVRGRRRAHTVDHRWLRPARALFPADECGGADGGAHGQGLDGDASSSDRKSFVPAGFGTDRGPGGCGGVGHCGLSGSAHRGRNL